MSDTDLLREERWIRRSNKKSVCFANIDFRVSLEFLLELLLDYLQQSFYFFSI
jgi:hypothetical protein